MWNFEKTAQLYDLVTKQKLDYRQAASRLGVSPAACERKYSRVDWKAFNRLRKNPKVAPMMASKRGEWSDNERIILHAMRTESRPPLSYLEISKKLKRTPTACERMFQDTIWKDFFERIDEPQPDKKDNMELLPAAELTDSLTEWMVQRSRCNVTRLDEINRHDLLNGTGLKDSELPCPFKKIKDLAKQKLGAMGFNYPEVLRFGKGVYVITGDSHGKHTKRGIFSMLKHLSKLVKADKVIHLGHALDDDGDISNCWEDVENLILLARREELQQIMSQNFQYDIARSKIHLGQMTLSNQDFIEDYGKSFIGTLTRNYFEDSTIVCLHRQELATRTTGGAERDRVQIASPGCLCEPHIVKVIRTIDFQEGRSVKVSYPDSFRKYRRMDDFSRQNWEQGLIVCRVDENGRADFIQCRIYKTSKGYTTSFFDKIVTEQGICNPSEKVFFNGDAHCHNHDPVVLDIQEQFCKDYKPDVVVNVGDIIDNRSCNHHLMERNGWAIPQSNILDEMASANYVLRRMRGWGKEMHLLLGNHERFAQDVADKFPQWQPIFDTRFMVGLDELGIKMTDFKQVLNIGNVKFSHGDFRMFGARGGGKVEKIFSTFGRGSIVGHLHTPTIRCGCYMVGMSGIMDQDYNEPEASSWMHGFGYINVFDSIAFVSLVNIRDHKTWINGKYYVAKNEDLWLLPAYKAEISFQFSQKSSVGV